MFSGGLGLPVIPLSGWRSKQQPREIDAFYELGPQLPPTTLNRAPTLVWLPRSVYSGVVRRRPKSSRSNHARQNVRSRRKNEDQQSPWDPRTNQSDQQCLISDGRHECRMHQTERGRLLARVTDEEKKAMGVTEYPEEHRDSTLTNGPDNFEATQASSKSPGKRLYRAASRSLRWR